MGSDLVEIGSVKEAWEVWSAAKVGRVVYFLPI